MSFVFFQLIIRPIELMLETAYSCIERAVRVPGVTIIFISILVNLILLPLYLRAERASEQERRRQEALREGRARITKAFRAEERFFILNAYYREKGYQPIQAVIAVLPLLLQIPFFIAAYRFFSSLESLAGASFLGVADLMQPDGLIVLRGGSRLHLLPILMTAVNCISGAIYTKGQEIRAKLQVYGLAMVFLVLLYESPAGLVLYWLMNNIFSAVKNALLYLARNKKRQETVQPETRGRRGFLLQLLLPESALVLFLGAVLPAQVISGSARAFAITADVMPMYHILPVLLVYCGGFMVWGNIYVFLMGERARKGYAFLLVLLLGGMFGDYLIFPYRGGYLMTSLAFLSVPVEDTLFYLLFNLLICCSAAFLLGVLWKRRQAIARLVFLAADIVFLVYIGKSTMAVYEEYKLSQEEEVREAVREIPLSRDGRNVVVIMLDRAISAYLPFLLSEKPELLRQLDGFTWYPNTVSYGTMTYSASAALYGGYEYTPLHLNERDGETLADKQIEALHVLPRVFGEAGFQVSIADPCLADYDFADELSLFDDLPYANVYDLNRRVTQEYWSQKAVQTLERNLVFFSLYRVLPGVLKAAVYDDGQYFNPHGDMYASSFVDAYSVLDALPELTRIQAEGDTFTELYSLATHEPALLRPPGYELFDGGMPVEELPRLLTLGDRELRFDQTFSRAYSVSHYHINMAALLLLGRWFDYLREQEVYDNTRIILVADHGWNLGQVEELIFSLDIEEEWQIDMQGVNPLLMVKDFDAAGGVMEDDRFMTNADVPALATEQVINHPINPYSGQPIDMREKAEGVDIYGSYNKQSGEETVLRSDDALWIHGGGNLWDPSRWSAYQGIYEEAAGDE